MGQDAVKFGPKEVPVGSNDGKNDPKTVACYKENVSDIRGYRKGSGVHRKRCRYSEGG
jgi:hypothetical protein